MNKVTPIFGCSFLLAALLGGSCLAAPAAQSPAVADAVPVSLDATNVPVSTALRTLFKAAGVQSYVMDAGVRGMVNANLTQVPFSVALKQVLSAAARPLVADVQDGVYHIRVRPASPLFLDSSSAEGTPFAPADDAPSRFEKFGVNHYDARMLADLATRRGGIIEVPPNFVIPANSASLSLSGQASGLTGPGGAFGPASSFGPGSSFGSGGAYGPSAAFGTGGGFGPGQPASAFPGSANQSAGALNTNNVLPDGIKRIFALQSDNSLVIEAGPTAVNLLSNSPFISDGYNPVP